MIKDRATVQRIFLPDGQYGLRDRFDPRCRPGAANASRRPCRQTEPYGDQTMTSEDNRPSGIGPGRARQSAIYRAGARGRAPSVPTDAYGLERRAKKIMSATAWAYVAGGAGEGRTMQHNREAFERWRIVPRMLHGVTQRNLATSVVGIRLSSPLLLAPIGAASLVAANSDVIIARGAASAGTPYVISSQGCEPMEDTAAAMGSTPFWYQLYWSTDEGLVDSMIGRAESCGARALVVTLDTTILGWRPRDLNLGSLPFARGQGIAQYTSDPRFTEIVRQRIAAGIDRAKTGVSLGAVRTLVACPGNTRELPQEPAIARAPRRGRDFSRHLLKPGIVVEPHRGPPGSNLPTRCSQGHSSSRRRATRG